MGDPREVRPAGVVEIAGGDVPDAAARLDRLCPGEPAGAVIGEYEPPVEAPEPSRRGHALCAAFCAAVRRAVCGWVLRVLARELTAGGGEGRVSYLDHA